MIFRDEILKKQQQEKKNFNFINSQGNLKFTELDMHIDQFTTVKSLTNRSRPSKRQLQSLRRINHHGKTVSTFRKLKSLKEQPIQFDKEALRVKR